MIHGCAMNSTPCAMDSTVMPLSEKKLSAAEGVAKWACNKSSTGTGFEATAVAVRAISKLSSTLAELIERETAAVGTPTSSAIVVRRVR